MYGAWSKKIRGSVTNFEAIICVVCASSHSLFIRTSNFDQIFSQVVGAMSPRFYLFVGSNNREMTELESKYAAEIERMRGKLRWYAENQALLDRDTLALKKKEEEIGELKETVARLQAHHGQTVAERKQRGAERATDAKRIQDLERQVSLSRITGSNEIAKST